MRDEAVYRAVRNLSIAVMLLSVCVIGMAAAVVFT